VASRAIFLAIDDAMLEEVLLIMPRRRPTAEGGTGDGDAAAAAEHDPQEAQVGLARLGRVVAGWSGGGSTAAAAHGHIIGLVWLGFPRKQEVSCIGPWLVVVHMQRQAAQKSAHNCAFGTCNRNLKPPTANC
jgi:hypothetical protein